MRPLHLAGLLVLVAALAPAARACQCSWNTPQEQFAEASAVFVGRPVLFSGPDRRANGGARATMEVEQWWKGSGRPRVEVEMMWGCSEELFGLGDRYVVYGFEREGGLFATSFCAGTGPVIPADDDRVGWGIPGDTTGLGAWRPPLPYATAARDSVLAADRVDAGPLGRPGPGAMLLAVGALGVGYALAESRRRGRRAGARRRLFGALAVGAPLFVVLAVALGATHTLIGLPVTDPAQYPRVLQAWEAAEPGLTDHFPRDISPETRFFARPGLPGGATLRVAFTLPPESFNQLPMMTAQGGLRDSAGRPIEQGVRGRPSDVAWGARPRPLPERFTVYVLRDPLDPTWPHASSSGIALSPTTGEVVYWADGR